MKTTIMILSLVMASAAYAGEDCSGKSSDESRDPASHQSATMASSSTSQHNSGGDQMSGQDLDRGSAEYHFKFETPGGMRK